MQQRHRVGHRQSQCIEAWLTGMHGQCGLTLTCSGLCRSIRQVKYLWTQHLRLTHKFRTCCRIADVLTPRVLLYQCLA